RRWTNNPDCQNRRRTSMIVSHVQIAARCSWQRAQVAPLWLSVSMVIALSLLSQTEVSAEPVPAPAAKPVKRPIRESTVRLPAPDGNGKLIREIENGGYRLKLDLSEQIIRLNA